MSRRKRYEIKTNHNSTFALNVTSMTDMFTIMLVFLLQTYTTAEVQVIPELGQTLPQSNIEVNPVLAIQVSVSDKELKIDDKVLFNLEAGKINETFLSKEDPNFIEPLFAALDKISKEEKTKDEIFQKNLEAGTVQMQTDVHGNRVPAGKPNQGILDGKILIKADQNLSYSIIKKIFYTASMAGFPKVKLATVVGR